MGIKIISGQIKLRKIIKLGGKDPVCGQKSGTLCSESVTIKSELLPEL